MEEGKQRSQAKAKALFEQACEPEPDTEEDTTPVETGKDVVTLEMLPDELLVRIMSFTNSKN